MIPKCRSTSASASTTRAAPCATGAAPSSTRSAGDPASSSPETSASAANASDTPTSAFSTRRYNLYNELYNLTTRIKDMLHMDMAKSTERNAFLEGRGGEGQHQHRGQNGGRRSLHRMQGEGENYDCFTNDLFNCRVRGKIMTV